jgi:hypothetical protein
MSRPKVFTVVGSTGGPTYSPVYPIDTYNNPTSIGIGVTVSGAETIADVQHTFGDPWSTNLTANVSAVAWINNATLVSATAQNNINGTTDTNYAFPPRAIRMRVRALTSAGAGNAATITIQQAGPEA